MADITSILDRIQAEADAADMEPWEAMLDGCEITKGAVN